ncbi:A1 family peptidase [Candidatus Binatia bacterium]|nr:A1 family peptidase [Candidatus Binatia bacterium]
MLQMGVGSASAAPTPTGAATLTFNDNAAPAKRGAVFLTKDVAITIPAPAPATTGATMKVLNPATGQASSVWSMPASGWTCTPGKVCKYADKALTNGPVLSAILKPGDGTKKSGLFKVVLKGASLDYALIGQGMQGHIGVVVEFGSGGVCTLVPEQAASAKKDDPVKGRFVAARTNGAPADASCPAVLAMVGLSGCAASGYTAPVTIGTQTFDLIADSGSTTLAVASTGCASCTGVSPLYAPGSTATDLSSTVSSTYGDGSGWSGAVFSDLVSLSPQTTSVRMGFAAIRNNLDGFLQQATCNLGSVSLPYQGLVGLGGPGLLPDAGTDSYLDQLAALGAVADVFSVRLCALGGTLWLGGYDGAAATTPPSYTPMVGGSSLNQVTLSRVGVGATSVTVDANAIVDTGTTDMVLPTAAFDAIASAVAAAPTFAQNFSGGPSWFSSGTCSRPLQGLTKDRLDDGLPMLQLTFPSSPSTTFSIDLPATDSYLLHETDAAGNAYYCAGIAPNGGGTLTIIGANAMHSLLTVFDRRNQRIGFAPGQGCPIMKSLARSPSAIPPSAPRTIPAPPHRHRSEVPR